MKKIIYSSLLVLAITLLTSACDNDSDMNSPRKYDSARTGSIEWCQKSAGKVYNLFYTAQ